MLHRYSVSPRLAQRPSRNGVLRHRRKTQLRPRRRAFSRRTYPAIRDLKKRWSLALVSKFTPNIQPQYSETFSVIGQRVFSGSSPILLQEMAVHLDKLSQANDYASINELLATVISFFMTFWCTFTTNDLLLLDFEYYVDNYNNFAKQLLEVFKRTASLIDQVVADAPPILKLYIESQRLCCSIFRSLNFHGLPEFFKELMVEFKKYLTVEYPVLEDSSVDGSVLDELRVAICENIGLYVMKDKGFLLFQGYLSGFVEDVLSLLVSSSSQHGREQLIVTAIMFLIMVCKSGHHTLLSRDDVLQLICESIVVPNIMLQDDVFFNRDPINDIKRNIGRSDMNTRRMIACELLKEIGMHYKDKLSKIVEHRVDICCSLFAFDAEDKWKYKDCAIRLLVSLALKEKIDLMDVETVFRLLVARQLGKWDVASFPVMKAGALKFLTLFRHQTSKPHALQLVPDLSRLVASPDQVVSSYAAICIEKLLLVEEDGAIRTKGNICPILPTLVSIFFCVFNYYEFEENNKYVIKCMRHVISVGYLSPDVASHCIEGLTAILHQVCENPKDSLFAQHLFQLLTALTNRVCVLSRRHLRKGRPFKNAISLVSLLENKLYPSLQMILDRDISGFFPYAFKLLAELLDLKRYPLLECNSEVFDILLLPDAWMRSEKAFLQKHEVSMLAIFDKLVTSLATEDEQGYYVLNTVIEHLGFEVISPFVSRVWFNLFNRLQYKSTVKRVKKIIVLMSRFLVKEGPKNLVGKVNACHPRAFQSMLEEFWIPNHDLIRGPIELKLVSVALTRVICESPDILDIKYWGVMLDNIMNLLSRLEHGRGVVDDEPEIQESGEEPLKDPRQFLVASLSKLFAPSAQGRTYHQAIIENLEQANQAALHQLFDRFHHVMV